MVQSQAATTTMRMSIAVTAAETMIAATATRALHPSISLTCLRCLAIPMGCPWSMACPCSLLASSSLARLLSSHHHLVAAER